MTALSLLFSEHLLHHGTDAVAPFIQQVEDGEHRTTCGGKGILGVRRQFGIDFLLYQSEVGQLLQLLVDDALVGIGLKLHQFAGTMRALTQVEENAALPLAANGLHRQFDAACEVNRNLSFVHLISLFDKTGCKGTQKF